MRKRKKLTPKKTRPNLNPSDHEPTLTGLFAQLSVEHLEELGAFWKKNARFVLCSDKLAIKRGRILFFVAGEMMEAPISRTRLGEIVAFIHDHFLFGFQQTLSDAEWKRWTKFADTYVRKRIQIGRKGRYRFQDRLFEIDTRLATMFNYQTAFQVEKNYRGSYSVRLYGVPLPGAEDLRRNDARFYLYNIYAEQFQFATLY